MRGFQRHMRRAGDAGDQMFAMPRIGCRYVARAGHDQGRTGDAADPVGQVHVADRRAATGIALRIHRQQLTSYRFIDGRLGGVGQETTHGKIGDGGHALAPHLGDTVVPGGAVHRRGGADRQQLLDPPRRAQRQFHADHAAQRDACHREAIEPGRIGRRQHIVGQHGERIIARLGDRGAMSARVDPQHSEAIAQMGQHAVPQIHVGADAVQQ